MCHYHVVPSKCHNESKIHCGTGLWLQRKGPDSPLRCHTTSHQFHFHHRKQQYGCTTLLFKVTQPPTERESAATCHLLNSGCHLPTSVILNSFSSFIFYLVIGLSTIMPVMSASVIYFNKLHNVSGGNLF